MKYKDIEKYLEDNIKPKRLKHIYGTVEAAKKLAEHYGESVDDAELAALLHDCAKNLDDDELIDLSTKYGYNVDEVLLHQPQLLHGVAGAYIAKPDLILQTRGYWMLSNTTQYHELI